MYNQYVDEYVNAFERRERELHAETQRMATMIETTHQDTGVRATTHVWKERLCTALGQWLSTTRQWLMAQLVGR